MFEFITFMCSLYATLSLKFKKVRSKLSFSNWKYVQNINFAIKWLESSIVYFMISIYLKILGFVLKCTKYSHPCVVCCKHITVYTSIWLAAYPNFHFVFSLAIFWRILHFWCLFYNDCVHSSPTNIHISANRQNLNYIISLHMSFCILYYRQNSAVVEREDILKSNDTRTNSSTSGTE